MINNVEFAGRLRNIMDYYQVSASAFADRIQVPRSSISHLLSGRNKPSLDFVLKVVKEFDEVELYWLLNGKGEFPAKTALSPSQPFQRPLSKGNANADSNPVAQDEEPNVTGPEIERIVIFYKDGKFQEYKP